MLWSIGKQVYYFFLSLRPKQWIKNTIIFIPLIFSKLFLSWEAVEKSFLVFVVFSFFVGSTYIINDYKDRHKDKNHPQKQHRPLVSGKLHPHYALG